MANLGIRTDASGTYGALTLGGVDKVTIGASGITAGSFAPNSIDAAAAALAFSGANQSLATNGYQKLPSGLIIQWGVATLPSVGNYNTQVIGGVTYYTNYYTITYPIAFTTSTYSSSVSIASATFGNQTGMAGHSASSNLNGNGSPLTRLDIAISSPNLGYVPTVHWMVIGQ